MRQTAIATRTRREFLHSSGTSRLRVRVDDNGTGPGVQTVVKSIICISVGVSQNRMQFPSTVHFYYISMLREFDSIASYFTRNSIFSLIIHIYVIFIFVFLNLL